MKHGTIEVQVEADSKSGTITVPNVSNIVSATICYNYDWYVSPAFVITKDGALIGSTEDRLVVQRLSTHSEKSTYIVSYLYC